MILHLRISHSAPPSLCHCAPVRFLPHPAALAHCAPARRGRRFAMGGGGGGGGGGRQGLFIELMVGRALSPDDSCNGAITQSCATNGDSAPRLSHCAAAAAAGGRSGEQRRSGRHSTSSGVATGSSSSSSSGSSSSMGKQYRLPTQSTRLKM